MPENRWVWRGKHAEIFVDETPLISVEGALNSGKTTLFLWKAHDWAKNHPGIWGYIGRYTDGETQSKIVPKWAEVLEAAGDHPRWDSKENTYNFSNGSKIFCFGLKAANPREGRYAKLRGLGVSFIYVDQAEELPPDFFGELVQRMRQPGNFPRGFWLSPNPLGVDSWLSAEFPEDNSRPGRKYYSLSLYDNAHNLKPEDIRRNEEAYPPGHAKHRTMILGQRGMAVMGEAVYKGAFVRTIHEQPVEYDPRLPLEMALDFGKHHPCAVFRQVSPLGQVRFLGGVQGQSLYLDDFCELVLRWRARWFPQPCEIRECCDPAGASDTSHGTRGATETLKAHGIYARSLPDANSPLVRLSAIERMAAQMRKRCADRSEGVVVNADPSHWLLVSERDTKHERFLADGFEAGYVWDEHLISVANKPVRRPRKDGWYEHGQNCAEYLELNFGLDPPAPKKAPEPPRMPRYQGAGSWMG